MSLQQINLYRPELRPKAEWLTANSLAAICCGFLLLMGMLVWLSQRDLEKFRSEVVAMEHQVAASTERIKRIQEQPRALNTLQLDRQIAVLRAGIAARESIGQIIQGQNLGNEAGFSAALNSIARQSSEALSLHHIRISRGGEFVEMRGLTRTPEAVPSFLQALKAEGSFLTSQFGLLSVGNASDPSVHEFAFGFESLHPLAAKGNVR